MASRSLAELDRPVVTIQLINLIHKLKEYLLQSLIAPSLLVILVHIIACPALLMFHTIQPTARPTSRSAEYLC